MGCANILSSFQALGTVRGCEIMTRQCEGVGQWGSAVLWLQVKLR